MKCDDARTAFLAGDEGQTELDHLSSCTDCRGLWASLDTYRRILDDPEFWQVPSPALEDRVVAIIGGPPGPTERPVVTSKRFNRRRFVLVGGVAAVLTVIVAWIGLRSIDGSDWKVAIPGTNEAPLATGVVEGWNEPGGTRVVLDIQGLAPAPEGSVYEFWFSRDDLHISAGTFVNPTNVELWTGVSRREFPRLWITLEPLDDDESPSGTNVMDTG